MNISVSERFWSKVAILDEDACWLWSGWKRLGYGRLKIDGKLVTAHRVAFELTNGPIPSGLVVRHACDNPSCCNPGHLLVGTQADNVHDMVTRKRVQHGEINGLAKLREQDIIAIRSKYKGYDRKRSLRAIAKEYGVCSDTIRNVVIGKTWKHVM